MRRGSRTVTGNATINMLNIIKEDLKLPGRVLYKKNARDYWITLYEIESRKKKGDKPGQTGD